MSVGRLVQHVGVWLCVYFVLVIFILLYYFYVYYFHEINKLWYWTYKKTTFDSLLTTTTTDNNKLNIIDFSRMCYSSNMDMQKSFSVQCFVNVLNIVYWRSWSNFNNWYFNWRVNCFSSSWKSDNCCAISISLEAIPMNCNRKEKFYWSLDTQCIQLPLNDIITSWNFAVLTFDLLGYNFLTNSFLVNFQLRSDNNFFLEVSRKCAKWISFWSNGLG